MTCFLQLEDGTGNLKLEDGTGSLLLEFCDEGYTVLQGPPRDRYLDRQNERYRQAKLDVERRQDAIIKAKLAANELTVRKRDLERDQSRQSARQLKALEREIQAAALEIQQLMQLLLAAEAFLFERKRNLSLILLMDADPFFNLGGTAQIMQ